MTVAAKCNITKYILEEVSSLTWGFNCKDNSCIILENYIEWLNCPSVTPEICHPDNCENNPVIFNCEFKVTKISTRTPTQVDDCDIVFYIDNTSLVEGVAPYTYQWSYELDDFDVVGSTTSSELKLKVKPGKILNLLVTKINVTVIDGNGCQAVKQCWFTPQGMECGKLFLPCVAPSTLIVTLVPTTGNEFNNEFDLTEFN